MCHLGQIMQDKQAFTRGYDAVVAQSVHSDWDANNNASLNECIDLMFRQSSLEITLLGLGLCAATLANGGTHPWTNESVFSTLTVQSMLKIMLTCGV